MILLFKPDYGCIFTLDPDTQELLYAPVYQNNTVNLNEFTPVELDSVDDEYVVLAIQKALIQLTLNN